TETAVRTAGHGVLAYSAIPAEQHRSTNRPVPRRDFAVASHNDPSNSRQELMEMPKRYPAAVFLLALFGVFLGLGLYTVFQGLDQLNQSSQITQMNTVGGG